KTTTIRLGPDAPQRTVDQARLEADETVLASGPEGVRVSVELRRAGSAARHFVVLFDRAAQLTAVESIEGLPASILEPFGLSEIFPAAAGAPPARPLGAGERWTIADQLRLAGSTPARLRGDGHPGRLGVVDGHQVAADTGATDLPARSGPTTTITSASPGVGTGGGEGIGCTVESGRASRVAMALASRSRPGLKYKAEDETGCLVVLVAGSTL